MCPRYNFTGIVPTGGVSYDWFDASAGPSSCANFLAVGLTCEDFGPSGSQEGKCDYTCNFCQLPDDGLPLCGSFDNLYMSFNYWDSWEGENACQALLYGDGTGAGATLCQTVYCDADDAMLCPQPHHCDYTCGFCRLPPDDNMMTLDQCVHNKCTASAPLWLRLSATEPPGPDGSPWASPQACVELVSNIPTAPGSEPFIVVPTASGTSLHLNASQCTQTFRNWEISYGVSLDQCIAPGSLAETECNLALNHGSSGPENMCEDFDSWLSDHAYDHLNSSDCSVFAIPPGSSLAHQQEFHLGPQAAGSLCNLHCQPGYVSSSVENWNRVCDASSLTWEIQPSSVAGGNLAQPTCHPIQCFTQQATTPNADLLGIPYATVTCSERTHSFGQALQTSQGGTCEVQCEGQLRFRNANCNAADRWLSNAMLVECDQIIPWACSTNRLISDANSGEFYGTARCIPPLGSCAGGSIDKGSITCSSQQSQCAGDPGASDFQFYLPGANISVQCDNSFLIVIPGDENSQNRAQSDLICIDGAWQAQGHILLSLPRCEQVEMRPCSGLPSAPSPNGRWTCDEESDSCSPPNVTVSSGGSVSLNCGASAQKDARIPAGVLTAVCTDGTWSDTTGAACIVPGGSTSELSQQPTSTSSRWLYVLVVVLLLLLAGALRFKVWEYAALCCGSVLKQQDSRQGSLSTNLFEGILHSRTVRLCEC